MIGAEGQKIHLRYQMYSKGGARLAKKTKTDEEIADEELTDKIKKIIACCIAWNFPGTSGSHPKLSWSEAAKAIKDLFEAK